MDERTVYRLTGDTLRERAAEAPCQDRCVFAILETPVGGEG